MPSPKEAKTSKKRLGRKRLPPLAPGPPLQFVVASHPDEFKAGNTMRHVRSHVMYKHRGDHRSVSPGNKSRSGDSIFARTPSPFTSTSDGILEDNDAFAPATSQRHHNLAWDSDLFDFMSPTSHMNPSSSLCARIISAITSEPARSAPPAFDESVEFPFRASDVYNPPFATHDTVGHNVFGQESLHELKNLYLDEIKDIRLERPFMETVCSNRMSFLSHVSVTSVYQDVAEGLLDDSALTVFAKTKVLRMIKESLHSPETQTDDFTILSILHLLLSEVGGSDEEAFDVHLQGLVRCVHQRGGINNLSLNGAVGSFVCLTMLIFAILRGHAEDVTIHDFEPSGTHHTLLQSAAPISPLFAPSNDLTSLYGHCSDATYELMLDMHNLTCTFIQRWSAVSGDYSPRTIGKLASQDTQLEQIYTRLLLRPSAYEEANPDGIYESCRLAALIYCRSIVQGVPFSDSANVICAGPNLAESSASHAAGSTVIACLHRALDHTMNNHGWENLSGLLLWICLIGGAASWQLPSIEFGEHVERHTAAAWTKKCFALFAVKASISPGLEHAPAIVAAQRTMLRIQHILNLRRGVP